jgi:hypothetical protein
MFFFPPFGIVKTPYGHFRALFDCRIIGGPDIAKRLLQALLANAVADQINDAGTWWS